MLGVVLMLGCVVMFSTCDYFATRWAAGHDGFSFWTTVLLGPFAYLLFGHLASTTSLAKMGAYVNCGIVLATTFAGVLLVGERLNLTSWIGILVIIVGIALLSMGKVTNV